MPKAFRQWLDPSLVTYANVGSDGGVTIPDTNTPVLVATIPFTTGPMPLSSSKVYAASFISLDASTADGVNSFCVQDCNMQVGNVVGFSGGSPPLPVDGSWALGAPLLPYWLASISPANDDENFFFYAALTSDINGSGDLDIYLTVPTSIGQSVIVRNLRVKALYFGSV
jgi:hypothetical protein